MSSPAIAGSTPKSARTAGPLPAVGLPSVSASAATTPGQQTAIDTAALSVFEPRPVVDSGVEPDGRPNPTAQRINQALADAYDLRREGRAVDTKLLYELARGPVRGEPDPIADCVAMAELAAMGAIDSRAIEHITTNHGFGGTGIPLVDRLAFALVVADRPEVFYRLINDSAHPTVPLHRLADALGKPRGGPWEKRAQAQAAELLNAARDNRLLDSPVYTSVLRSHLAEQGHAIPEGLQDSARGLLAFQVAIASGAAFDEALSLGNQAKAGGLDVVALRALTADDKSEGSVRFAEQHTQYAYALGGSLSQAAAIATSVAQGKLTFGQLHGFMFQFARGGMGWGQPLFQLSTAVEAVMAFNRGEIAEPVLAQLFNADTYFSEDLADRVFDHFFSNQYRDYHQRLRAFGKPLTMQLTGDLVLNLGRSPEKLATFVAAFQEAVRAGLPTGLHVLWDKLRGPTDDAANQYRALVDSALAKARHAAGV